MIRCAHEIQDVRVMELFASFACREDDEQHKSFRLLAPDIAPEESIAPFEFLSSIKNLQKLQISHCGNIDNIVIRELAILNY